MKRKIVHIVLLMGTLVFSTHNSYRAIAATPLYRDSLHRHIWIEGAAELSCGFTYPQGSSHIHTDLKENAMELSRLDDFLRSALTHPGLYIERIRLTGYSSVEGSYHINEELARERVEGFYLYLREHYPELYRYPHDTAWVPEDWDGLARLVKSSVLYEREEVLEIIRKVRSYDTREELLTRLNGGRAWREMQRAMLPGLRRVEIRIEYTAEQVESHHPALTGTPPQKGGELEVTVSEPVIADTLVSLKRATDSPPFRGGVPEGRGGANLSPHFALKTNLLAWAGIQPDLSHTAPVANIALEYFINQNISIELGAAYSYWNYNDNKEFQGISGYRLESRYRFPVVSDRLEIYLGIYARFGDYDLRDGASTVNSGLSTVNSTGDYRDAGISAGLTIPLTGHLGLELGARAGYVRTDVIRYTKDGDYNWFDSSEPYSKVKTTDLNISLIYKFR